MKTKITESRTLKALSLGLGLAAAFQAVTGTMLPYLKAEPRKQCSMPRDLALPKHDSQYAEVLGMN